MHPDVRPCVSRCAVRRHSAGAHRLVVTNETMADMGRFVWPVGWHSGWIPDRRRTHSDQQENVVPILCPDYDRHIVCGVHADVFAGRRETVVVGKSIPVGRNELDSDLFRSRDHPTNVSVSLANRTDEHALYAAAGE